MTIDREIGTLYLPEIGVPISPNLELADFVAAQASRKAPVSMAVQSGEWSSFTLPEIPLPDTRLRITLQFTGEKLITIGLMHSADRFGCTWESWSEAKEFARKAFHDQWLTTELGTPAGEYSWGTIHSSYDPKGGFSSITISYT